MDDVSPRPEGMSAKTRVQRRNERGETPLHVACIKGDLKLVTSLMEQDADINAVDNAGTVGLVLNNTSYTGDKCVVDGVDIMTHIIL